MRCRRSLGFPFRSAIIYLGGVGAVFWGSDSKTTKWRCTFKCSCNNVLGRSLEIGKGVNIGGHSPCVKAPILGREILRRAYMPVSV